MRDFGNPHAAGEPGERICEREGVAACRALRRFRRNRRLREASPLPVRHLRFDEIEGAFGLGVADDDPETAPRRVAFGVIVNHDVAGDAGDELAVADDRVPERVLLKDRGIEPRVEQPVRVVAPHLLFAQDHFAFLRETRSREFREADHARKNPHRFRQVPAGEIRVIGGVVVACVGVHRAAEPVDRVGRRRSGIVAASLKQHVFEKMRQPVAEAGAFVDAAGADKAFDFDRRAGLRNHDNPDPVLQRPRHDVSIKSHDTSLVLQSILGSFAAGAAASAGGSASLNSMSKSSGASSFDAESSPEPISR